MNGTSVKAGVILVHVQYFETDETVLARRPIAMRTFRFQQFIVFEPIDERHRTDDAANEFGAAALFDGRILQK